LRSRNSSTHHEGRPARVFAVRSEGAPGGGALCGRANRSRRWPSQGVGRAAAGLLGGRPAEAAGRCIAAPSGSRSFGLQPGGKVAEFGEQCRRFCLVGTEPGKELPVLDGIDGLIHASGQKHSSRV
jgi:hypothetical protein